MSGNANEPDYAELVGRLGLADKVRLLTGATTFTLALEERIGLGEVRVSDGPTGVRGLTFSGGPQVTLFPNATLLSASWNDDTAYEVGELLAEEAMAQQLHAVLGPTINLHRSVLGGRLFEAYSEDPLLTGRLAAAYVRGLQSAGVAACLKHLIANESETDRNTMDSVLSEKTLRELYLLPFEIAVAESQPWSVMAAYNDVNGVAATEQGHVNTEVVKGEWGWDGVLMSDWFATKTAGPAANGGLDLVMPGPAGPWGDALVAAVESREVDEAVVDDHLVRLLRLADRVGALAHGDVGLRSWPEHLPTPDSRVRHEQLTRLAASGITVLSNDGVLPLQNGATIALIGRHAVATVCMGGGSAQVNPPYQVSIADGLTELLGDLVTVVDGVEVRERPVVADGAVLSDPGSGEPGVVLEVFDAAGRSMDVRHQTTSSALVGFDDNLPATVGRVVLTARTSLRGPVEVGVIGRGRWSVQVGAQTVAFDLAANEGGMGAGMLAPPSGSQLLDLTDDDLVTATLTLDVPEGAGALDAVANLGLTLRPVPDPVEDVLARAAAAAAEADVAVVVVGTTEEQETEAVDKSTIALFGAQDALVQAVAAAARPTVVVVNAATPVLMPWAGEVDAVVVAGLPGQEGGHAVAAALLGLIEPAGRLVTSYPSADGAAPAWEVVPTDGVVRYDEGTAIGYRGHWAGTAPEPAYWFGHGLGYGSWAYGDAEIAWHEEEPRVVLTVTNVGERTSREVVQVYFDPVEPDEPVRLVGWTGVSVDARNGTRVTVDLDRRLWRRWDEEAGAWGAPLRAGELLVARGLGDVRARLTLL